MNFIKMQEILSLIMAGIVVLSMSTVTFAEEVPDFEKDISIGVELNEESTTQNVFKDVINIKESELKRTGETISLSKQRSDQTINNSYGVLPGTLTSTNTWDYYLFISSTNFIPYSKIATNNSYYTLTLGYVDYASANCYDYPNSIFIELASGGIFTHKFTQNAPYYNWGNKDASGAETPRVYEGGGYLIYDLNTDKVVEFADGKAHPWSYLGDKHSLSAY